MLTATTLGGGRTETPELDGHFQLMDRLWPYRTVERHSMNRIFKWGIRMLF